MVDEDYFLLLFRRTKTFLWRRIILPARNFVNVTIGGILLGLAVPVDSFVALYLAFISFSILGLCIAIVFLSCGLILGFVAVPASVSFVIRMLDDKGRFVLRWLAIFFSSVLVPIPVLLFLYFCLFLMFLSFRFLVVFLIALLSLL